MKRKVVVPNSVSRAAMALGLPREVAIALWNHVHNDVPASYSTISQQREPHGFRYKKMFKDDAGEMYLFILFFDDVTSPDHLIIEELHCIRR